MIGADQLEVLADKAGLELARSLGDIPIRHAPDDKLSMLESLGNAAEVELGHLMDYNVLFAVYLRRMAQDLAQYLIQMGSGEYILYEREGSDPEAFQKTSTQGFGCRVTLTREAERGILGLDIRAANFQPGQLPAELLGE